MLDNNNTLFILTKNNRVYLNEVYYFNRNIYQFKFKDKKMNISKHAELRIKQRGISKTVLDYVMIYLPCRYENQSNKILLTKKIVEIETKKLQAEIEAKRNIITKLEKHKGTEFVFNSTGEVLITVYRRPSRK